MIAIITPAKTIDEKKVRDDIRTTTPRFLDKSELVMNELKKYEIPELCSLMKTNDKIGSLTFMRSQEWQKYDGKEKNAAVFSFNGEVYRGLDAKSFTNAELEFCNNHLRILSGVYGSLRPLDGMMPYRLEMGTRISINGSKNLYDFWNEILTESIIEEAMIERENVIINLASDEYAKVLKLKGKIRVVTPIFKEKKGLKYKTIVVYTKKARGMFINYMTKNKITNVEELKGFDYEGYEFDENLSDDNNFVFTRENYEN